MTGSLKERGTHLWSIILDVGYVVDPVTQKQKRKQTWITFRGSRRAAMKERDRLVGNPDAFVKPDKMTLGQWLDTWCNAVTPTMAKRTVYTYKRTIAKYLKPSLGAIRLQRLRAIDLEQHYNTWRSSTNVQKRRTRPADQPGLSEATLHVHHTILSAALTSAVTDKLVSRNVAKDVKAKPKTTLDGERIKAQSWSATEARTFLSTTSKESPQIAAFFALALDSGARKSELLGLRWTDVDLGTGAMSISRQLLDAGVRVRGVTTEPSFPKPKTKQSRTIDLSDHTLRLLREHKRTQAEVKMQHRTTYRDFGLIFAREPEDGDALGWPLSTSTVSDRTFRRLVTAAGVKPIAFHGLRHTCASVLLNAGEQYKVVQERLGHKKATVTMDTYAYSAVTSNLDLTLAHLWRFACGRGNHEKTIAQLKSGLAFHTNLTKGA